MGTANAPKKKRKNLVGGKRKDDGQWKKGRGRGGKERGKMNFFGKFQRKSDKKITTKPREREKGGREEGYCGGGKGKIRSKDCPKNIAESGKDFTKDFVWGKGGGLQQKNASGDKKSEELQRKR